MITGTRLWTDGLWFLWVGGEDCYLGELDSLGLLEAFLPGSRPLFRHGSDGVLSIVKSVSDVCVVKYKPVVLNEHTSHSYGFLVEVFLQQSYSLRKLELIHCQPTAFFRLMRVGSRCKTSLEDETKPGDLHGIKPTLQLSTWPRLM